MDSLGLIEVIGFISAIEAVDSILMNTNAAIIGKEEIGGGLVTVALKGEVADVKAGVEIGASVSKKLGQVVATCIIGRPEKAIFDLIRPNSELREEISAQGALGLIEVKGLVPAILAADTALKAANVNLIGRHNVGLGLISVVFQGDVSSIKAAIEAGSTEAEKIGEVVSNHIISRPHKGTYQKIVN